MVSYKKQNTESVKTQKQKLGIDKRSICHLFLCQTKDIDKEVIMKRTTKILTALLILLLTLTGCSQAGSGTERSDGEYQTIELTMQSE